MQIPLTLPESTTPLPARRDIQALSPVSPVPGVEGLAETLDPRLSLQWTQPVLGHQSADLTRSSLESVSVETPNTGVANSPASTVAAGPTVTWSSLAQVLGPLLQRMGAATSDSTVPWPTTSSPQPKHDQDSTNADAPALLRSLNTLHHQLAESDLFASQHLMRHWFRSSDATESSSAAGQAPDITTLSRWVSALSPDSTTAEQITRMLLTGKMHWQGELLPGIAVQLDREDAWREDPQHPGQIHKGAALRAQIDLPRSGRLIVTAYQWGADMDVRVHWPSSSGNALDAAWPQLHERLAQLNVPALRLQRESSS